MILAKNLTKQYGDKVALDHLTLDIAPGEIFCLLGQNGAGKTTTINCFLGFTEPTSGKALINGLNVAQHPLESKKHLAYLPEVVMLYPWLTFTLVVPALVNMVAQKAHPVPSRAGFQTAMRDLENQLEASREKRLDDFYRQHPNLTRKKEAEKEWKDWYREDFALQNGEKRLKDSLEQTFEGPAKRQAVFADNLTLFSPALSVHRQMADLAGTSRRAFEASVASFDAAQRDWAAPFLQKFEADQNLTLADYDTLMKFPDRVAAASAPAQHSGMWWLLLQCLLAGIWAWWSRRRFGAVHLNL